MFCIMSCSFSLHSFKLNDLDKYLLSPCIFKDCLELDVHDMTSQILSILIDFNEDAQSLVPFFQSFFKSLNLNSFGTRRDIRKR